MRGRERRVCERKWVALSLASTLSRAGRRTGEAQEWAEEGRWVTGERLKERARLGLSSQQGSLLEDSEVGRSSGRRGSDVPWRRQGRGSWRCSMSPRAFSWPLHPSSEPPALLFPAARTHGPFRRFPLFSRRFFSEVRGRLSSLVPSS